MRFKNGCNKVVIELRVVQFWSENILVISNRTRAARSSDFEITRMISDQIHSVQLPLLIKCGQQTLQSTFLTSSCAGVSFNLTQLNPDGEMLSEVGFNKRCFNGENDARFGCSHLTFANLLFLYF